jgi:hypothetical protein
MTEIKNFCKKHGITEEQFIGLEAIKGNLFLNSLTEIPEGFKPIVGCTLSLNSLTEMPKRFFPDVGGDLLLNLLTKIPNGFSPTVERDLYLNSLTEIPKRFNPIVLRNLHLDSLKQIPEGFNPIVGGDLWLNSLKEIPDGYNPTVRGSLYLGSLTEMPKGFNPTVGGDLWFNSLIEIPKGFNPTVRGDIRIKQIPEGFNISEFKYKTIPFIQWDKYIKSDNVLSEVISKKGNIWTLKDIDKDKNNIYYLVTDGNGNYAHGNSIKQAKEDLIFKISNRDSTQYRNIDLDKKYNFDECITMYRCITGSCSAGVNDFIESNNIKKQSYSVNEIITLTKNNYGNKTLNSFFKVK